MADTHRYIVRPDYKDLRYTILGHKISAGDFRAHASTLLPATTPALLAATASGYVNCFAKDVRRGYRQT